MARRRSNGRSLAAGALGAAIGVLFASPAVAKEGTRAICTAAAGAYKRGIEQEKAGQYRDAVQSYAECAQASVCGGLAPRCKGRQDKLASRMPTVVPTVTDANGEPTADVEVRVDGQLLTTHLDGVGLPVTPGVHEFRFSARNGQSATQKVMIIETQRDREIAATLAAAAPPQTTGARPSSQGPSRPNAASDSPAPPGPQAETAKDPVVEDTKTADEPASSRASARAEPRSSTDWALPTSPLPYVLGGAGVAALIAGGLLTYWGNRDNGTLESSCAGACPQSSVDHVRAMYLASDVSYAAGAAALAVTTFLFATSRATERPLPTASHEALSVGVQPTRSGAFASVSGAF